MQVSALKLQHQPYLSYHIWCSPIEPSLLLFLGTTRNEDLSTDLLRPLFRGLVEGNSDCLQRKVLSGASILEDLLNLFLGEAMVRDGMRSSMAVL